LLTGERRHEKRLEQREQLAVGIPDRVDRLGGSGKKINERIARAAEWRITGASVTSDGILTVWGIPEGEPDDREAGQSLSLGMATYGAIQTLLENGIEVCDWRRPGQA